MLKMYGRGPDLAGAAAFWDLVWEPQVETARLQNVARLCERDPLWALLKERVRPRRLFLDGGCGLGQWVKYFHDRGLPALGIDFAPRTLARLGSAAPSLEVWRGDVRRLPIADGAVHVYLSSGVVEHFEEGPAEALAEARRVTAPDGWFVCSVPDESWLRRLLLLRRPASGLVPIADVGVRRVESPRPEAGPPGWRFFQYAFRRDEFRALLEGAGFVVTGTVPVSLAWGLLEIPGWRSLHERLRALARRARRRPAPRPAPDAAPVASAGAALSLAERLLLREDPTVPLLGPALRLVAERAATMRVYLARPA